MAPTDSRFFCIFIINLLSISNLEKLNYFSLRYFFIYLYSIEYGTDDFVRTLSMFKIVVFTFKGHEKFYFVFFERAFKIDAENFLQLLLVSINL